MKTIIIISLLALLGMTGQAKPERQTEINARGCIDNKFLFHFLFLM